MNFGTRLLAGAAILAVITPSGARADSSAFLGALAGGALGSAIGNAVTQPRTVVRTVPQTRTVVRRAPVVNTYEREQNREVQTALNYFGFSSGVPDGVLGRNSRGAIAQYQATLGYPSTGYLNDYERVFLTSSYSRAIVGGPQNQQLMATYGQGVRGLLLAYRAEQQGVAVAATPVPPAVTAPAPAAPVVAAAVPTPAAVEPIETAVAEPVADPVAAAGLPSFLAATADSSMASACNRVGLVTSTNGGFVTAANLSDPAFALDEQFCLARSYAIEDGDRLAATVDGVSAEQIREQCDAFAPVMRPYVAMLGSESVAAVEEQVRGFIVKIGAPPSQIAGNARICLGVGYRTDNAELALGSALLLEAAGEAAYGEHVGHHLRQGFGVPKRGDRAIEWLDGAVLAMENGASPMVSPGAPERVALLRQSLDLSTGHSDAEVLSDAAAPAVPGFVLPAAPTPSN